MVGDAAVLDAVRRCWGSLWTERAMSYRQRRQIESGNLRMAVVVQRMVDAEFAGVMFTANPVTGERDQIVIDANPGLGEAVVSGLVTPDHYVLDARGEVRERTPGRREVVIRSAADGSGVTHSSEADAWACDPARYGSDRAGRCWAAQSPPTSVDRRTSNGRTPAAGSGWSRRVR